MQALRTRRILSYLPTVLYAITMLLAAPATVYAGATDFPKDWILRVDTEEQPRQLAYKGTSFVPVAKVGVQYSRASEQQKKKQFEYVWYHDGKPIGMERAGKLEMPDREVAAIEVHHKKQGGTEEYKAAANIILRLFIDTYHNGNSIAYVQVPANSFRQINEELRKLKFEEAHHGPDERNPAKFNLYLESDPVGIEDSLYYY